MILLKQFLAMGGYAFYVWTSYGMVLLIMCSNLSLSYYTHRRLRKQQAKQ
jgi:heme exporter protein D